MKKPIQQKQKAGIVTSLNDTTLTKVTYGKYATRVIFLPQDRKKIKIKKTAKSLSAFYLYG